MKRFISLTLLLPFVILPCTAFGEDPIPLTGKLYEKRDHTSFTPLPAAIPPEIIPVEVPLPTAPDGTRWKQTFADEFDGEVIDKTKWVVLGDTPRKTGFWLKRLTKLDGKGNLVLTVDREEDQNGKMRSIAGAVESRGKFEQKYGYYVCRYKMLRDNGAGYHCAFWLQSPTTTVVSEDGRNGTEIDIIEKFHHDDIIQHCLHWNGFGKDHDRTKFAFPWPGIEKGFHTFALKWTPTEYTFYVDGVQTWQTKAGGVSQVPAFLRLTLEFSQGWNGDISKADLPDEFVVDYVRVYEATTEQ